MKKILFLIAAVGVLSGCSTTVVVKKDSCKDIYDGVLMECEQVKK